MNETVDKKLFDVVDILLEKNDVKYNKMKASEEFQELALVLTQQVLKPFKVDDQEVIDEIGDCIIRLTLISRMYDKDKIAERLNYKLDKFLEYIEGSKYENV